jgi:uncharacterized protein (TIGR02466 family)
MEKSVSLLFPTPIGNFRVPDTEQINRELKQLIFEREKTERSQVYANAGGWHSRADLLEWPHPATAVVQGWIMEAVNHMISATLQMMKAAGMRTQVKGGLLKATAWANVSRYGHYHRMHNHPGSAWSGVYYVDPGREAAGHPLSGLLELIDPRPYANMVATPGDPFGQKAIVKPEAGLMVLFPGWFPHFVHPYFGEEARISISFNVVVSEGAAAAGSSGQGEKSMSQ